MYCQVQPRLVGTGLSAGKKPVFEPPAWAGGQTSYAQIVVIQRKPSHQGRRGLPVEFVILLLVTRLHECYAYGIRAANEKFLGSFG